jgi:hypothetical protein
VSTPLSPGICNLKLVKFKIWDLKWHKCLVISAGGGGQSERGTNPESPSLFQNLWIYCLKIHRYTLGIGKVRFYTSLCQETSSPRLKTRKVLSFGYSGLSFGRYLESGSFQREFTLILARAKRWYSTKDLFPSFITDESKV